MLKQKGLFCCQVGSLKGITFALAFRSGNVCFRDSNRFVAPSAYHFEPFFQAGYLNFQFPIFFAQELPLLPFLGQLPLQNGTALAIIWNTRLLFTTSVTSFRTSGIKEINGNSCSV